VKQSLFGESAQVEDEENWKRYVGEGGSKEAGSMTNRPAEEGMGGKLADLRIRLDC
jgi:hypothetical protein